MIKLRIHHNSSCLKCNSVKKELLLIGSLVFCRKCYKEEFKNVTEIAHDTLPHKTYKKWLTYWKKKQDEEYKKEISGK